MKFKYPYQVASIKQEKQGVMKTLGVDARLSIVDGKNEVEKTMPLETPAYSRFVLTLIRKSGKEVIFPKANIPADEVDYIFTKTKMAMQGAINASMQKAAETVDSLSPGYIERFQMGALKGKTPAELLIENENNKEQLIKQKEFLSKNADKFPANKKLITAIDDAVSLLEAGKLNKTAAASTSSNVITIYDEQMKTLRSTRTIIEGVERYLVYGIKIEYNPDRNLPFCLTITNCMAPVAIDESGKMNPRLKQGINVQTNFINLTEKDWYKVINKMVEIKSAFNILKAKTRFKMVSDAHFENDKEAKTTPTEA